MDMNPRLVLAFSLAGNLILAAVLLAARARPSVEIAIAPPATHAMFTLKSSAPPPAKPATPNKTLPWALIESEDYRQYIANLRAVECPDWLVRDIIVADVDDLYEQKTKSDPIYFSPWQGETERSKEARSRTANLIAMRREKRALVKTLLGYEWDNHANEVWNQDILTSLTLGFLPDEKVSQLLCLKEEYTAAARTVREDANFILIDDDRAKLRNLYEGLETELSQLLDPADFDELQLRTQKDFLLANDIHFDGMAISDETLRSLVRMSKTFKDMALNEFVPDHPLSESEESRRMAAFEDQVQSLLGPAQFADYQRAQDPDFRDILEFSQQNNLPETAAIQLYQARQTAGQEADDIQKEADLSPDERAELLAVLKAVTLKTVSSVLGGSCQNYLAGSGQWLRALAQTQEFQTQKQ
jgi:hypothetical protein